jgi:hypothetical protein
MKTVLIKTGIAVIGPLLLSYFILTVEMFSKEYLSERE